MRSLIIAMFVIQLTASLSADDLSHQFPIVPEGFTVDLVAAEPVVSNPCDGV